MISPQNTKKVVIILSILLFLGIVFSAITISIFLLNKDSLPLIKDSELFPSVTTKATQVVDDLTPSVTTDPDGQTLNTPSPTPSPIGYPDRLIFDIREGGLTLHETGGELAIKGSMHGFFEGVMNYQIIDADGVILTNGIIQAQGDNYKGFVPFEVSILYGELKSDKYFLEFFDVSMKDGTMNILSRIPLRII